MLNQVEGGVGRRAPGEGISAGMKSMRFLPGSPAGLLGTSQPEACGKIHKSAEKAAAAWEQPHSEPQTCWNGRADVLRVRAVERTYEQVHNHALFNSRRL